MSNRQSYVVREICKFLSGLVAADILAGLWMWSQGLTANQSIFGLTITTPILNTWLVIDAALLLILIFYGWHIVVPVSGSRKTLLIVVGILLGIVSIAHFLRLAYGLPVVIGTLQVPMWLSVIGSIITGFLAYSSLHFAVKK